MLCAYHIRRLCDITLAQYHVLLYTRARTRAQHMLAALASAVPHISVTAIGASFFHRIFARWPQFAQLYRASGDYSKDIDRHSAQQQNHATFFAAAPFVYASKTSLTNYGMKAKLDDYRIRRFRRNNNNEENKLILHQINANRLCPPHKQLPGLE